jgi:HK97 family phage portal protein
MSLIGRWLGLEPRAAAKMLTQDELATLLMGATATTTGRALTPESALTQVTVLACVRLLAEVVGTLPCVLYRRLAPRGRERATSHPLYGILHDLPNPELTTLELYENITGHLALWGNAYCEIEYDNAGRRRAVWPLRPDRVEVLVPAASYSGQRQYVVTLPNGQRKGLARWQIWHIRGFGTDPWIGKSPIALARESVALALGTEEFAGKFFGNDSRPGGVLKSAKALSEAAAKRLQASWEGAHGGLSNAHRVAVLEEGVEWQSIGIPAKDAQFLEMRQFQRSEIYGLFRVMPHLVGDVSNSTSWGTGIEQQSIGWQKFSVGPYLTRIEKSAARDLLTTSERETLYARFLVDALVRADINGRTTAYEKGRLGGWLSVNDIREMEDLNPVEGGDTYLQPLNMTTLGSQAPAAPGGKTNG